MSRTSRHQQRGGVVAPLRAARLAATANSASAQPHPLQVWGDLSLEERIPTFLEAVMFEPEAEPAARPPC